MTIDNSPSKAAGRSDGETQDDSPCLEPDLEADCYAQRERAMMVFTQRVRGRLFGPLLGALDSLGTTPNHLTLASLLAGLAFCPVYFWSMPLAFVLLAIHVVPGRPGRSPRPPQGHRLAPWVLHRHHVRPDGHHGHHVDPHVRPCRPLGPGNALCLHVCRRRPVRHGAQLPRNALFLAHPPAVLRLRLDSG